MDARQRRTRTRLHETVLAAARDVDPSALTMTGLAAAAGVHRSTVHDHAATPEALLRQALLDELDALRADLLDDPDRATDDAVTDVTARVLEHVRRHAPVYRRGLADGSGSGLQAMLAEHFVESSRRLRRQGRLRLPGDDGPLPGVRVDAALAVDEAAMRFVALGTVGLIQAWVVDPDPAVEDFTALVAALLPSWWRQG